MIVQMRHPYVPILTSRRKSGTSCFRGYIFFLIYALRRIIENSGTTFDFHCLENRFIFDCLDQPCGFTGKFLFCFDCGLTSR